MTLPLTAGSRTAIEARVADKAGPPGLNDDVPAPRQKQSAGPAATPGNPAGQRVALHAPAYAQIRATEYRSGERLLRTTSRRQTRDRLLLDSVEPSRAVHLMWPSRRCEQQPM